MTAGGFGTHRKHAIVIAVALCVFVLALMRATNQEIAPGETLSCVSLALALAAALIFATRRIALGLLLTACLVLALRTISLVKQNYLGVP